jgi:hypothetical protein
MNQTTTVDTDSEIETEDSECETDEDHEIDRGSFDILAMDRESVQFVVSCGRCGAQVSVCAQNPEIQWGEPEDA